MSVCAGCIHGIHSECIQQGCYCECQQPEGIQSRLRRQAGWDTSPISGRAERRIWGANSRSAAWPPKNSDQCCEALMIPMYSRTSPSVSCAVCILKGGHEGKHKTSETHGNKEWV